VFSDKDKSNNGYLLHPTNNTQENALQGKQLSLIVITGISKLFVREYEETKEIRLPEKMRARSLIMRVDF